MIVTEQMLAPHRFEGQPLPLVASYNSVPRNTPRVPTSLFSQSSDVLQSLWGTTADEQDPRTSLQVVPVLAFTQRVPILKPERDWIALKHQAGGHACDQVYMIATMLKLRPTLVEAMNAIAREGYHAEGGHFYRGSILASRIANYVGALAELDLDCEGSWPLLTESIYPVDATQENLSRIAEDAPQLDDVADWSGFIRARYSSDPAILLLTENSD